MDKDKEWIKKDIVDIYNKVYQLDDLFCQGTPDDECTREVLINRLEEFRDETAKLCTFVGKILYG